MIRATALIAFLCVTACTGDAGYGQPQVGLGIGISPQGVRVMPRLHTNIGGAHIGLGRDGASVGTTLGSIDLGATL